MFSPSASLQLGDESGFDQHAQTVKLAILTDEELEAAQREESIKQIPHKRSEKGRFTKANQPENSTNQSLSPPPSPTLATNTPLPLSPEKPHLPLSPEESQPTNLPRPRSDSMTTTAEVKLFRGDYSAGEKPHIWFRRLECKFDEETKLATKLYRFAKNLEPG